MRRFAQPIAAARGAHGFRCAGARLNCVTGAVLIKGGLAAGDADESEGLDIFDLDVETRPGMAGQLHLQLLNNNLDDDNWWLSHWRAPIDHCRVRRRADADHQERRTCLAGCDGNGNVAAATFISTRAKGFGRELS